MKQGHIHEHVDSKEGQDPNNGRKWQVSNWISILLRKIDRKYHPSWVMITACNAKSTPSRRPPLGAARLAGTAPPLLASSGEITKHATTNAIRARALIKLVSSCIRLPVRSPSQLSRVRTTTLATDTSLT